jgi:hypothetical protein
VAVVVAWGERVPRVVLLGWVGCGSQHQCGDQQGEACCCCVHCLCVGQEGGKMPHSLSFHIPPAKARNNTTARLLARRAHGGLEVVEHRTRAPGLLLQTRLWYDEDDETRAYERDKKQTCSLRSYSSEASRSARLRCSFSDTWASTSDWCRRLVAASCCSRSLSARLYSVQKSWLDSMNLKPRAGKKLHCTFELLENDTTLQEVETVLLLVRIDCMEKAELEQSRN